MRCSYEEKEVAEKDTRIELQGQIISDSFNFSRGNFSLDLTQNTDIQRLSTPERSFRKDQP